MSRSLAFGVHSVGIPTLLALLPACGEGPLELDSSTGMVIETASEERSPDLDLGLDGQVPDPGDPGRHPTCGYGDSHEASDTHDPDYWHDHDDHDGHGTSDCGGHDRDDDYASCEAFVTRENGYWKNHSCVVGGGATSMAYVPISLGTTYTLADAAEVHAYLAADPPWDALRSSDWTRYDLGRETIATEINARIFGIGPYPYMDADGDGQLDTVDDIVAMADTLFDSGTRWKRARMQDLLDSLNEEGEYEGVWFTSTCLVDPEWCNGEDDDGDGIVDKYCANLWYLDQDGDGYGDANEPLEVPEWTSDTCGDPPGYAAVSGDCDDDDPAVNPSAEDVADGLDNDCDGDTDEDLCTAVTWYLDEDGDGYGDATATTDACEQPPGYAATGDDCDDGDATVNPGAPELCDALDTDEDCDGLADDEDAGATGQSTWFPDDDGDGFGAGAPVEACDAPSGTVANDQDCDDARADVNPDGVEVCDDLDTDEDCTGLADDEDPGATGQSTWFADTDGDGLGDPASATTACEQPSSYVADSSDACPLDPDNDADGDGVCGDVDACPGFDDTADTDGDGTPDGCDVEFCDGLDNDGNGLTTTRTPASPARAPGTSTPTATGWAILPARPPPASSPLASSPTPPTPAPSTRTTTRTATGSAATWTSAPASTTPRTPTATAPPTAATPRSATASTTTATASPTTTIPASPARAPGSPTRTATATATRWAS